MPHYELFAAMVARLRSWSDAAGSVEIACTSEELADMRRAIHRADVETHRVAAVVDADHFVTLRFTDGFVGTFAAEHALYAAA